MLSIPCIFLLLIHQPPHALTKTQFMTNINLLCVAAPGCHPQGVFQDKRIRAQSLNISMHHPRKCSYSSAWNAYLY